MLYTDEEKRFVFTRDWPRGLVLDIFEATEPLPHLNFVFYRDNFIKFDTDQQARIASTVQEVMTKLRKDGIPCYLGKMEKVSDARA
jgi:chemotaxis methyl-accepting protein methylase